MEKKKLLVFGEDWGSLPTSTQYLVAGLINFGWEVIWVNSIGMREPSLSWKDFKRVLVKLQFFLASLLKRKSKKAVSLAGNIQKPLAIINPLILPFYSSRIATAINRALFKRQSQALLKKYDFQQPYVMTALPTAVCFMGLFNEKSWLYYCCDDFTSLEGVSHKVVGILEKKMLEKAAVVSVSSRLLLEKFKVFKPRLIEHGVDFDLFSTPVNHVPEDLPKGRPVVGFYGSISAWLDFDLIRFCAGALPEVDFVLIGRCETDCSLLRNIPNIYFLDAKPHEALPSYVQHWQLSMLPFRLTQQIMFSNPLKLREYLASGTPLISVRFPAAEQYEGYISIADNQDDFVKQIKLKIKKDNTDKDRRIAIVKDESWLARAKTLERALLDISGE